MGTSSSRCTLGLCIINRHINCIISAPGLGRKRTVYLYKNIRQSVDKDIMCPRPNHMDDSSSEKEMAIDEDTV